MDIWYLPGLIIRYIHILSANITLNLMLSAKTKPDFIDGKHAYYFSEMKCRRTNHPFSRWRNLKITKFSTGKSILFIEVGYKTNAFTSGSEEALKAYFKWQIQEAERILLGNKV